jgi:putative membrane protein
MRTKLTIALASFALAALSPAVFAQSKDAQQSERGAKAEKSAKSGGLQGRDQRYFNDLAQANMAEVAAGKLAENKAQSEEVKKYGRQMVEDHGKMLEEQQQMAKTKNVQVPQQPKKEHQSAMKKLEGLSGDKFDEAFMEQMVKDHEKSLKLAREAAKNAKDPELKQAAEKAAPHIEEHLKMARQVSGAAAGGTSSKKSQSRNQSKQDEQKQSKQDK